MSEAKKKVYVETTVVSDATALPTNDLALVGRQVATREWWRTAAERFAPIMDMFVRRSVLRKCCRRRCRMMHDATLEEMWRIKEKLSAPNDSWEEYAASLYAFQEEERRNGVRFATLPPRKPELAMVH